MKRKAIMAICLAAGLLWNVNSVRAEADQASGSATVGYTTSTGNEIVDEETGEVIGGKIPSGEKNKGKGIGTVKTGDDASWGVGFALLGGSGVAAVALLLKKKQE